MTTLAASMTDLTLSCDSFINDGNRVVKLMKGRGMLIGYAGCPFYATALAQWVLGGREGPLPSAPDESFRDDETKNHETTLLILRKTGITMLDGRGTEVPLDGPYAAIGSGGGIAQGAMWSGRSTEDAIRAAADHDPDTKLPVHTISLKRTRKK